MKTQEQKEQEIIDAVLKRPIQEWTPENDYYFIVINHIIIRLIETMAGKCCLRIDNLVIVDTDRLRPAINILNKITEDSENKTDLDKAHSALCGPN